MNDSQTTKFRMLVTLDLPASFNNGANLAEWVRFSYLDFGSRFGDSSKLGAMAKTDVLMLEPFTDRLAGVEPSRLVGVPQLAADERGLVGCAKCGRGPGLCDCRGSRSARATLRSLRYLWLADPLLIVVLLSGGFAIGELIRLALVLNGLSLK